MRLLIAAILIAILGCSSSPTEPLEASAGTLTLRYGGSVTVAGTTISFTDVTDSRCPKDVACVWEGDAAVRLDSGSAYVVLHTSERMGPSNAQLGGVTITLVEVKPQPVSTTQISKTDYTVTLRAGK